ncbi:unnamed protein product, partial [Prorocentrum cordatum]
AAAAQGVAAQGIQPTRSRGARADLPAPDPPPLPAARCRRPRRPSATPSRPSPTPRRPSEAPAPDPRLPEDSTARRRQAEAAADAPAAGAAAAAGSVGAVVARALGAGTTEAGLDGMVSALRGWAFLPQSEQGEACWMLPALMWLAGRCRRLSTDVDRACAAERHRTRLVEALRELFQKLHRERARRGGALAVCCELLRLYVQLGQASQCSFLLAAMCQVQGGLEGVLSELPKALAVTLFFLWGKHCVLDGNVAEAEEKLGWALAHCPPCQAANRRAILGYLVPCRLRMGRYPAPKTLRRHNLERYEEIARAVSLGDVRLFNRQLEAQEEGLIRSGTFLVVEKLRLLAYQNLCRRVYDLVASDLEAAGRPESRHKQDLRPFERAFAWQDGCDEDETLCILANLIYVKAIRGYLSDEHRKIVFSKESPFPPAASWCASQGV